MMDRLITNWKKLWERNSFKREFLGTVVIFFGTLFLFSRFIKWVELRSGVTLNDPVLAVIPPTDVTWVTFALIYSCIIMAVLANIFYPRRFLLGLQVYSLMVILRAAAMFVIPLDPPKAMIPLADPFVEIIGTGQLLTRDLFFSGHTATMVVLWLCVSQQLIKKILLIGTAAVAFCLLLQHVHYTIDVMTAPFFAYGAYRALILIHLKLDSNHLKNEPANITP